MSKEAEKLAGLLSGMGCWETSAAAAIIRRQAEQIRELRTALKRTEDALTVTLAPCGEWPAAIKSTQREALKNIRAALSNTKEPE